MAAVHRTKPFVVAGCFATLLAACATVPSTGAGAPRAAAGVAVDVPQVAHPDGETAAWWHRLGASQAAARGAMNGRARNVILFVGDGRAGCARTTTATPTAPSTRRSRCRRRWRWRRPTR